MKLRSITMDRWSAGDWTTSHRDTCLPSNKRNGWRAKNYWFKQTWKQQRPSEAVCWPTFWLQSLKSLSEPTNIWINSKIYSVDSTHKVRLSAWKSVFNFLHFKIRARALWVFAQAQCAVSREPCFSCSTDTWSIRPLIFLLDHLIRMHFSGSLSLVRLWVAFAVLTPNVVHFELRQRALPVGQVGPLAMATVHLKTEILRKYRKDSFPFWTFPFWGAPMLLRRTKKGPIRESSILPRDKESEKCIRIRWSNGKMRGLILQVSVEQEKHSGPVSAAWSYSLGKLVTSGYV